MFLQKVIAKLLSVCLYPFEFKRIGKHSKIVSPLRIDGKRFIFVGDNVEIQYKTWLACVPLTGVDIPVLHIGDGTRIGNFNHIYATQEIIIEDNVLTADKVYISDNSHSYTDIEQPIWQQSIKQLSPVRIGEGSWLGENVCVIGASVGKHCVIGANSVVTHDIPDYSIAVGSPAKVIKRYNMETKIWEKI